MNLELWRFPLQGTVNDFLLQYTTALFIVSFNFGNCNFHDIFVMTSCRIPILSVIITRENKFNVGWGISLSLVVIADQ